MTLKFSLNISMQFCGVPFLKRFNRVSQLGFDAVEFHFPYKFGIEQIKERIEERDLKIILFNLHPGETDNGEWGTLSNPAKQDYFRWSLHDALDAALKLNCNLLNVMFGKSVASIDPEAQIDCACENLSWASTKAADAGVTLLIEPLNEIDFPEYFLCRTSTAIEVINRVKHPNVRLLYDVYHAQMVEGNIIDTIASSFPLIEHIQIADVPGRHEPGTGEICFSKLFGELNKLGYEGYIGLEYHPLRSTEESLIWLNDLSPLIYQKSP